MGIAYKEFGVTMIVNANEFSIIHCILPNVSNLRCTMRAKTNLSNCNKREIATMKTYSVLLEVEPFVKLSSFSNTNEMVKNHVHCNYVYD